jgi:hypothetical protein
MTHTCFFRAVTMSTNQLQTKEKYKDSFMLNDRHGTVKLFFLLLPIKYILYSIEGGELFERIQQQCKHCYTERDAALFISMVLQAVTHFARD